MILEGKKIKFTLHYTKHVVHYNDHLMTLARKIEHLHAADKGTRNHLVGFIGLAL